MATSIYGGYLPQPGRWSANVKLGGVNTPPIEWIVDETLPVLGQDLHVPNHDWVVIARGRIVAPRATTLTRLDGRTVVTLANGVDPLDAPSTLTGNVPIGYAPFHFYREFAGMPADRPTVALHETIELPYTAVNEAYNVSPNTRLVVGECLMPYFGSNNSNDFIPADRGKLVRWVEKEMKVQSQTASAIVVLAEARFPAFKPHIIVAFTSIGLPIVSGATLSYNTDEDRWVATFSGPVESVIYEYGAGACQKVAQVVGIEPVGTAGGINATSHDLSGWLKWVTDNFGAWDWPPIMSVRPTSSATEALTISNNAASITNKPIVPFKPITVTVTGTLTDPNTGTETTLTGSELELADEIFFNDYTQGKYYDIDFLAGTITFASNLSVTAATISYFYENTFRDGLKYDAGILGLTDGRDSGIVGLPPHLDVAGVRGVLRVMILR